MRERQGIVDPLEKYDRARVEDAAICRVHSDWSITASMSRRSESGSIAGNCDHRSMSTLADTGSRPSGTRSATGLPSRVTVIRSPRATRSTMPPPSLRRSRIEISVTRHRITRDTRPVYNCTRRRDGSWLPAGPPPSSRLPSSPTGTTLAGCEHDTTDTRAARMGGVGHRRTPLSEPRPPGLRHR